MKVNEIFHGFEVISCRRLDEIDASMWTMEYRKNGAQLIWLERNDANDNKTFAITFKTLPSDDTGVFHILEHSVLCGSSKYPVREPFVELLKSSLQTFLNAFTYPDKTMYPVCSRNEQDFLNLMDVYLDAVFHPLSLTSPLAFRQEGWHYEIGNDEDSTEKVTCNGVVYNEMKGAYASPDRTIGAALDRQLFPDNCYSCSSGGDPDHIAELTYEQYCESHRKYYSATNSRIFLDGKFDTDAVFSKLDSVLSAYDRIDVESDIPYQKPVHPAESTVYYPVSTEGGEDIKNKAYIASARVFADFSEQEKIVAASMIANVLCGSNEAPVKKAILDRRLAEDISMYVEDGVQQASAVIKLKNTDPDRRNEIWDLIDKTIADIAEKGIDRGQLEATLNRFEFNAREKDFGSTPAGLVYGMIAMDSWLYGGDPALTICSEGVYKSLREKLNGDYFEKLLKEIFIDCPHTGRVLMLPSNTLEEENAAKERQRTAAAAAAWSEEDKAAVRTQLEELRAFQQTPDSPEKLASLPVLSLSDIPEEVPPVRQFEQEINGVTVLRHPQDTNGIIYGSLYFRCDDLNEEELRTLSLLDLVLGDLGTEKYSALELDREIKANLGDFWTGHPIFSDEGDPSSCRPYFTVSFSALESKAADIIRLIPEIILRTKYDDKDAEASMIKQNLIGMERGITMSGNSYAIRRAGASLCSEMYVNEVMGGIDYFKWLQNVSRSEKDMGPALAELAKKVFVRDRMTFSVTGTSDEKWMAELIESVTSDPSAVGSPVVYEKRPLKREGVSISNQVGFAAKCGTMACAGGKVTGPMFVASQYLSYDYLWNSVRVQGGAYGVHLSFSPNGTVNFSSYRDPQAARSLDVYDHAADQLRTLCRDGSDSEIEKYIISALSSTDPLLTPRGESSRDVNLWMRRRPKDTPQRLRKEILRTSRTDLLAVADLLDDVCGNAGICVVGGKASLEACAGLIDETVSIKK